MLRLSSGYISPQGNADPLASVCFVQDETAPQRGRYRYRLMILQPFGGRTVARKLTIVGNSAGKIEIAMMLWSLMTVVNEAPIPRVRADECRMTLQSSDRS